MKNVLAVTTFLVSVTAAANSHLNNSRWNVISKFCDSKAIAPYSGEKIILTEGFLMRVRLSNQTSAKYCKDAEIYTRLIAAYTHGVSSYQETAVLSLVGHKTQCFKNGTKESSSSKLSSFGEDSLNLELDLLVSSGTAEIRGSSECPQGILQLSLKIQ